MCDPLTIAGIALSGVATAANSAAQSSVNKARDDALAAERIRQKGFDREADAVNARAQNQYDGYAEKQDQRGQKLSDYFQEQATTPTDGGGPAALPQSSSNITVQADTKARKEARDFTDMQGAALGNLRSFGDLMGELGRGTAREAGYIGQIGSFKKGSSAVLPYELESANGAGTGMRTLGDVLSGIGKIGISAGLSGATPFGIGAPSTGANVANSVGSMALGRAVDRASVPGYSAYSLFGR